VRGAAAPPAPELAAKRRIIEAFLAASRSGDLQGLLEVLDPDVVSRADPFATRLGGAREMRGAEAVANAFVGRAQAARTMLVDGALGFVVAPQGRLLLAVDVTIRDGRIVELSATADPGRLAALNLAVLD
jgi:RNA polymerase sigma-70 factor (ECF subfamily)